MTFDQCQYASADSDSNNLLNVIDVDYFARLITEGE